MSKISSGAIMLAFVAVLFGLFGAYVVREVLSRPRKRKQQTVETITVPMASMDLKPGRTIALGDIGLARMTRAEMKERGISRAFMTDTKQIIGRTLRKTMKRGDRFDTTLFYPDGMRPGLVDRLKPGLRAVTIPVWSDDALLGFAGPGSWVDVIFRSSPGGQSGAFGPRYNDDRYDQDHPAWQDYTRHYASWHGDIGRNRNSSRNRFAQQIRMEQTVTLLEHVQVLAVDRETFEGISVDSQQSERMSVTLAVTPEQAASLRVVDGRGELSLALRSPNDDATVQEDAPRTLEDIIDIPDDPVNVNHDMEVYRGFRMSRVGFDGSGIGSRRGNGIGGGRGGGHGGRGGTSLWSDLQDAPPVDGPPANVAYAAEAEARAAQGR